MSAAAEGRTTFERALTRRAQRAIADENSRAEDLLQRGGRGAQARKAKKPLLGKVLLAMVVVAVVKLLFFSGQGARGTRPLNAVALASADGTGLGSSPVGFLSEPSPTPQPSAASSPGPAATPPAPRAPAVKPRGQRGDRRPAPLPAASAPRPPDDLPVLLAAAVHEAAPDYAVEIGLDAATPAAPPTASLPAPTVVNMGTRLHARLESGVRTGATLTPVTAVLTADLRAGDRVILPAGTRAVGSAFATTGDDRVQLVWRALVVNGRTVPFEGVTLADDGTLGLVGKVIDRRGKGILRRIGSVALTAAGATAAYGVPGGDGVLGRAGDVAADQAGRQLERMGQQREWLQADKVVELRAGAPCVVYVSSDVVLPRESER